jgi:hypothetical protein
VAPGGKNSAAYAKGTSTLTIGVIKGIAKTIASITKIFSGALSDWLGRGKLLAAFAKPVYPLAPTVDRLVAARFIDRVGKGIRGAPQGRRPDSGSCVSQWEKRRA